MLYSSPLPRLAQALGPLQAQWGIEAMAALRRIWQVEQCIRRRQLSLVERRALNASWDDNLDVAALVLGNESTLSARW